MWAPPICPHHLQNVLLLLGTRLGLELSMESPLRGLFSSACLPYSAEHVQHVLTMPDSKGD